MSKSHLHNTWIALRSTGLSYRKIATRIGVSKKTQSKWEEKFRDKLESLKSKELEFISDNLRLGKKERLERLSGQLEKLENELEKRDISDVPTANLLKSFTDLIKAIQSEMEKSSPNVPEVDESMIRYFEIISQITEPVGEKY